MLNLPNFSYLAGCELHIQTLTFLIILTLKQYVDAKTIWGNEVHHINHRDDYCPLFSTFAASIPANSWSFYGEEGYFRTKSAFHPWSAIFSLYLIPRQQTADRGQKTVAVCGLWFVVCSLHRPVYQHSCCLFGSGQISLSLFCWNKNVAVALNLAIQWFVTCACAHYFFSSWHKINYT